MPKYTVQSRESWILLVEYSVEGETQEEAEQVVKDGHARHHDFERIHREVERIVDAHVELEM